MGSAALPFRERPPNEQVILTRALSPNEEILPVSPLSYDFDPHHWLVQARAGQVGALEQLIAHYRSYLVILARMKRDRQLRSRLDDSDLVQEACMSALRDFWQFRGSSEQELTAWLRQILAHVIANHGRDHRRERRDVRRDHQLQALDESSRLMECALADPAASPSRCASRREQAVLLANALATLSDDYREVIVLRDLQGKSLVEIAQIMGRSVNAVQKLWARAVMQLRRQLTEEPERS